MESFPFQYRVTKKESGHREMPMSFDELKFVHIMSGEGRWNINGEVFSVERDDVLIFSRSDLRYLEEVVSAEPLVMEQVIFLPITVYPAEGCVALFFEKERASLLPKNNEYHTRILEDFASIRKEIERELPYRNEWIANRITSMVISTARLLGLEKKSPAVTGRAQYATVCKAISYLHEHLEGDLSRETIAAALYVSPSHLSRIFKEYTGVSPIAYVSECRLNKAKTMLIKTEKPIEAVMYECGFSNRTAFFKKFSEHTGSTPLKFRRNQK